jgi:DNA-binding transcriptional ArsR family regulator
VEPDVFAALGDPTRRRIVELLAGAPDGMTATALAAELGVTRQAAAKHLEVLRVVRIARAERVGRESRHRLVPDGLDPAERWLTDVERAWARRTQRLRRALDDR